VRVAIAGQAGEGQQVERTGTPRITPTGKATNSEPS
jgi:hypothetical protein